MLNKTWLLAAIVGLALGCSVNSETEEETDRGTDSMSSTQEDSTSFPNGTSQDTEDATESTGGTNENGSDTQPSTEATDDSTPSTADTQDDTDSEPQGPFVRITFPTEGSQAETPVTIAFEAGGGVVSVNLEADGYALNDSPIPASRGNHVYDFSGVGYERTLVARGLDDHGTEIASSTVHFTPVRPSCALPDQPGFNHYTVRAINDTNRYPKDGTYPYCWSGQGDSCNGDWGMVHDASYGGEVIFSGGGDCYCSGHTLEIFLRAFALYLADNGLPDSTLFDVDGSVLPIDSVDIGAFYQYWQGFGITDEASSADAFENAGIGQELGPDRWDEARPGDFVNLSRSTGSGHSVIFAGWIVENNEKVGLRYYGCNGSGDSCPSDDDPLNDSGNSGPSYNTEYFEGQGGTVLPEYLFIGRVNLPTLVSQPDTDSPHDTDSSSGGTPGDFITSAQLTYYWVSYEGDFSGPKDTTLRTCGGAALATVPSAFAQAIRLEGTGKLVDGRLLNVSCSCSGGYSCFVELDESEYPWGMGSHNNPLKPFTSIATDTSLFPYGTVLYSPDLDGVVLPGGEVHDGCLRADDIGGGIVGAHIDWFVGLKGNYLDLASDIPDPIDLYASGSACAYL